MWIKYTYRVQKKFLLAVPLESLFQYFSSFWPLPLYLLNPKKPFGKIQNAFIWLWNSIGMNWISSQWGFIRWCQENGFLIKDQEQSYSFWIWLHEYCYVILGYCLYFAVQKKEELLHSGWDSALSAGGPGSIPGQGTRSYMLHLNPVQPNKVINERKSLLWSVSTW